MAARLRTTGRPAFTAILDRSVSAADCLTIGFMVEINRRAPRNVVRIPVEHIAFVAEIKERFGAREAAKQLGFGRGAMLGIIANGEASPGTLALLREALARRGMTL
jgi:hypothetical protein